MCCSKRDECERDQQGSHEAESIPQASDVNTLLCSVGNGKVMRRFTSEMKNQVNERKDDVSRSYLGTLMTDDIEMLIL